MLWVMHDHAEAIQMRKEMISLERGQIGAGNAGGSPVAFVPSEAWGSSSVTQPANAGRGRAFKSRSEPLLLAQRDPSTSLRFAPLRMTAEERDLRSGFRSPGILAMIGREDGGHLPSQQFSKSRDIKSMPRRAVGHEIFLRQSK